MSDRRPVRPLVDTHVHEGIYGSSVPTPPAIILRAAGLSWADAFGQPFEQLSGDHTSGVPDAQPLLDWIEELRPPEVAHSVVVVDLCARPESVLDVFAGPERTEPLRLTFVLEHLREQFQTDGRVATLSPRRCAVATRTSGALRQQVAALSESLADLGRVWLVDLPADAVDAQALVGQLAA